MAGAVEDAEEDDFCAGQAIDGDEGAAGDDQFAGVGDAVGAATPGRAMKRATWLACAQVSVLRHTGMGVQSVAMMDPFAPPPRWTQRLTQR